MIGAKPAAALLIIEIAICTPCNSMMLPQSDPSHSFVSQSPHIAYTSNDYAEIFIIGTSHFSSNSASEVQSLITTVKPNGVVLELDPERCLRLTKQSCGFDASGNIQKTGDVKYGADFVAAIDTCIEMDIPLFLGDEYAQDTRERMLRRMGDFDAYSPTMLIRSLSKIDQVESNNEQSRINVIETFRRDPRKLTPLVVTTSPPFMLTSLFSLFNNQHTASVFEGSGSSMTGLLGSTLEVGFVLTASILLSSLLFNNVIVERDKVLAESTSRAANVLRSLMDGRSIRKRWKFQAAAQDKVEISNNSILLSQEEIVGSSVKNVPLFTLKTPIRKHMIRNLNLFEPRWLKMMDQLTSNSYRQRDNKLGCVRCTNKFYSAVSINGVEGRYADVIFNTIGNLADVLEVKEEKRPVSGDRRLSVTLRGGDSFLVDKMKLSVCDDGYIIASDVEPQCLERMESNIEESRLNDVDEKVRIVVVVGLLHGNGVHSLLSSSVQTTDFQS